MLTVNQYKDILLEWFYYNKEDNTVRRAKDGYYGRYKKDDIVKPFILCSRGYDGVHIPKTRHTVPYHHLVALLQGIEIPDDKVIDHIDGNPRNNDISNMRVVTQQENSKNKKKKSTNSTGVNGITISNQKGHTYYVVRATIQGKRVYLGMKKNFEEAEELLNSYREMLKNDGYTERHGK